MPDTVLTFLSNPTVLEAHVGPGPGMSDVQVNLMFWGKGWSATPPPALTAQTIASGIRSIINSNYLDALKQYGVTGAPSLVAIDVATDTDPSHVLSNDQLEAFIKSRIDAGAVNPPPADHRSFYAVIFLPKAIQPLDIGAVGAHSSFIYNGIRCQKAWILNDSRLDTKFSPVHVFSHEFAEAVSDPNGDVKFRTATQPKEELGDVCKDGDDLSNGYSLHSYYSAADKVCVLPLTRAVTVGAGAVAAVSRGGASFDLAVVDHKKITYSAAWDKAKRSGLWRGWWSINGGLTAPAGSISLVSRQSTLLDAFMTGTDGKVYTAAWDADWDVFDGAWRGWWKVGDVDAPVGAPVGVASRGPDQLDIFVIGAGGHVDWAQWDQNAAAAAWRGWWRVLDFTSTPGGHVTAVSRDPGRLDIFAVSASGDVQTASRLHDWGGWWSIAGGKAPAGAPVAAVSRDPDKLDVFVVQNDGGIYHAAWDQHVAGGAWRGWWRIGDLKGKPASVVAAVSRGPGKLDVFAVDENHRVWTTAWDEAVAGGVWQAWQCIPGETAAPGSSVSAVSRGPNKLDVFIIGQDRGVWTASWDQGLNSGTWQDWQPVPN